MRRLLLAVLLVALGCKKDEPRRTPPTETSVPASTSTSTSTGTSDTLSTNAPDASADVGLPVTATEDDDQPPTPKAIDSMVEKSAKCTPGTPVASQYRSKAKHRAPAGNTANAIPVTVAAMVGWAPLVNLADDSAPQGNENNVYVLEADIWRVKVEDNDCDYHVEVTAHGDGAKKHRVIVEVPQGQAFEKPRKVLAPLMHGGKDVTQPLHVKFIGYAFFDGHHACSTQPWGCQHGSKNVHTLWELHPAWDVQVVH